MMLRQVLIILLWLFCGCRGSKGLEENAELQPKFKVVHKPQIIAPELADELMIQQTIDDIAGSYEIIRINNTDTDMLCYIPQVRNEVELSNFIGEDERPVPRTDDELIDQVLPNFLHYFDAQRCTFTTGLNDGYWTYGYCFGDKVVQFHENLDKFKETGVHTPEYPNHIFVLGRFEGTESADPKIINQSTQKSRILHKQDFSIINDPLKPNSGSKRPQKALKHLVNDGGICDLTNKPRTIEVIYRCDPSTNLKIGIIGVSEIMTCDYQMIINVRALCNIEEFAPNNSEEKVIDLNCHDVGTNLKTQEQTNPDDQEYQFPQPVSTQVDLQDFDLQPGGNGFFWGYPKAYGTSSNLYDHRSVVFFNKDVSDTRKFIHEFSRMFSNSMELKIHSPDIDNPNGLALWDDTFTAWYELYNQHGEFYKVIKVARIGNLQTKSLNLQLVDPFEMTDQDGDPVVPPKPAAHRSIFEYEKYDSFLMEETISPEYQQHQQQQQQAQQPRVFNGKYANGAITERSTITVTKFAKPTNEVQMDDVLEVLRERLGIGEDELFGLMNQLDGDKEEGLNEEGLNEKVESNTKSDDSTHDKQKTSHDEL